MPLPTMALSDLHTLWQAPDQAGVLRKFSQNRVTGFVDRYVVLKGSTLFIFKSRKDNKRLAGVVPLEGARVTEGPPTSGFSAAQSNENHLCISITLSIAHAYTCKHDIAVFMAPSPEVHGAWLAALRQAAIPREALLARLASIETAQNEIIEAQGQRLALAYPTQDPAVVSFPGQIRFTTLASPAALHTMSTAAATASAVPVITSTKGRTSITDITAYAGTNGTNATTQNRTNREAQGSPQPGSLRASFSQQPGPAGARTSLVNGMSPSPTLAVGDLAISEETDTNDHDPRSTASSIMSTPRVEAVGA